MFVIVMVQDFGDTIIVFLGIYYTGFVVKVAYDFFLFL